MTQNESHRSFWFNMFWPIKHKLHTGFLAIFPSDFLPSGLLFRFKCNDWNEWENHYIYKLCHIQRSSDKTNMHLVK